MNRGRGQLRTEPTDTEKVSRSNEKGPLPRLRPGWTGAVVLFRPCAAVIVLFDLHFRPINLNKHSEMRPFRAIE
jgi:hypothetical protein